MGVLRAIIEWLRGRRGQALPEPPFPPGDPRRELFLAIAAYAARYPDRARKGYDDFIEFIIRADPGTMAQSLSEVISECKRLGVTLPEEKILSVRELSRRPAAVEADLAAKKIREDMRRRGVRGKKHYYTAGERPQTGEVDRTYEVDKGKNIEGPG